VCHLVCNGASFLSTEAPLCRVPDKLSGCHSQELPRRSVSLVAQQTLRSHGVAFHTDGSIVLNSRISCIHSFGVG
jgi:hypothetical protein